MVSVGGSAALVATGVPKNADFPDIVHHCNKLHCTSSLDFERRVNWFMGL